MAVGFGIDFDVFETGAQLGETPFQFGFGDQPAARAAGAGNQAVGVEIVVIVVGVDSIGDRAACLTSGAAAGRG